MFICVCVTKDSCCTDIVFLFSKAVHRSRKGLCLFTSSHEKSLIENVNFVYVSLKTKIKDGVKISHPSYLSAPFIDLSFIPEQFIAGREGTLDNYYTSPQSSIIMLSYLLAQHLWRLFYWFLIGWFIKFHQLFIIYRRVIQCIIIGHIDHFFGHSLFPYDP